MSFYGNIKRINSSPYVFDKIYSNRKTMEEAMANDNIYIGRYVLVKYTYNSNDLAYFDKYEISYEQVELNNETYQPNIYYKHINNAYILATGEYENTTYYKIYKTITTAYQENAEADINKYGDTFDATVWQKIYTNIPEATEKYILVAELNAAVPRLELDVISPKQQVKDNDNNRITEIWNNPSILQEASSEDAYVFQIPNSLHLDVGAIDEDFYGKGLIDDPSTRKLMTESGITTNIADADGVLSHAEMMSPKYNYMSWKNQQYDAASDNYIDLSTTATGNIDAKKLDTKLYAFGQMVSDLYDVLYGVPRSGVGPRPFFTTDLSEILSNYDKGLVGILSSIATDAKGDPSQDLYGRSLQPGLYYYFNSKWCDASEDPDSFIENIPEVIGSNEEYNNSKSHYKINFSTTNGNYIIDHG